MLIQPYQPSWADDFMQLREILVRALHPLKIDIEHVGSTAVPGLAAKPIIDMDIVFYESAHFDEIKARLDKTGYYHHGNQGIPDREVFKRRAFVWYEVLDSIPHHLYVCSSKSEELQRHLLFRDYLRKHPDTIMAYQILKYDIAEQAAHDRKTYAQLKESMAKSFIQTVIDKAKTTLTN
ncbi:MAG: GrpB family protein [Saprospiraceae bacterium]|nr:GrpB family protein [Saprospiraceae bacterium]